MQKLIVTLTVFILILLLYIIFKNSCGSCGSCGICSSIEPQRDNDSDLSNGSMIPIYIINGEHYPDRYKKTTDILNEMNFNNYTKWNAVFPSDKNVKMFGIPYKCPLKIGMLGCSISHRTLWKHIYENHKIDKWVVIFEDDIMLPQNIDSQEVRNIMNQLMIQGTKESKNFIYFGYCMSYLCLHAYAVTPEGAKLLYDNTYDCTLFFPKPIDNQIDILRRKNVIQVLRACEYKKKKKSWADGLFHQRIGESSIKSHE